MGQMLVDRLEPIYQDVERVRIIGMYFVSCLYSHTILVVFLYWAQLLCSLCSLSKSNVCLAF